MAELATRLLPVVFQEFLLTLFDRSRVVPPGIVLGPAVDPRLPSVDPRMPVFCTWSLPDDFLPDTGPRGSSSLVGGLAKGLSFVKLKSVDAIASNLAV